MSKRICPECGVCEIKTRFAKRCKKCRKKAFKEMNEKLIRRHLKSTGR